MLQLITITILLLFTNFSGADFNLTEFGAPEAYSTYINHQQALYKELFVTREYNSRLSPVYERMPDNWTESEIPRFNVHLLLEHIKIFNVDSQAQILLMYTAVNFYWQDWRLAWDPAKYGGIEEIWLNIGDVWLPENQVAEARSINLVYPDNQRQISVKYNGSLFTPMTYYLEISCVLNVFLFPFDRQSCPLPYIYFSYRQKFTTMSAKIAEGFLISGSGNGEWEVTNVSIFGEVFVGGIDNLEMKGFLFELRRVPNFYIYVVTLPCFILTLLSIIGMFWSANFREEQLAKLSIGLTSLISQTVLLDMVSQAIPKTATFPLLGLYVVFSVVLTSVACVVVVVFTMSRQTDKKEIKMYPEKRRPSSIKSMLMETLQKKHIAFHILFQSLNFIGFIILLSFWG